MEIFLEIIEEFGDRNWRSVMKLWGQMVLETLTVIFLIPFVCLLVFVVLPVVLPVALVLDLCFPPNA